LEEISTNRGIFYDPEVADACLRIFEERKFSFDKGETQTSGSSKAAVKSLG
jgi:hypothetical protein